MIKTNCTVCSKTIFVTQEGESYHPPCTKYWSYNEDGSKRPYCSCACGLEEYQNEKKENEQILSILSGSDSGS